MRWTVFKAIQLDLGIAGGLYNMSIDYKMVSEDSGTIKETDFTVSLPVIGLRGNFLKISKKGYQNIDYRQNHWK